MSIPLFSDDARAAVGTDFKRKGRFEAKGRGSKIVQVEGGRLWGSIYWLGLGGIEVWLKAVLR